MQKSHNAGILISMKTFVQLYALAAAVFVAMDMIWLTQVANGFYKEKLGKLLAEKASLLPAVAFYALFIVGLVVFVIKPGLEQGMSTVAWRAALFGLVTYATYDLTNQATLKNWPGIITVVDMIWGMVLATVVCTATVFLYNKFN